MISGPSPPCTHAKALQNPCAMGGHFTMFAPRFGTSLCSCKSEKVGNFVKHVTRKAAPNFSPMQCLSSRRVLHLDTGV